eukprot:TRINITY_DN6490_c0_g2_i1.p1 TRINITY_DN6490_c0_g2~~TRINITY_DN6490_c0_g2_i1.p1  ORF type:complete len:707 (+),score=220.93 TRINITY_DN6490_c0_g2_i1:52-2172(+)
MPRYRGTALFAMLSCALAAKVSITPAQKVVSMLAGLKKTAIKDGAKDAEDFKAYAKFCDVTKNEKAYQIEKSEKKIQRRDANIEVHEQAINQLTLDLATLGEDLSKKENELSEATASRAEAAAQYAESTKEIDATLLALERAIKGMDAAKSDVVALTSLKKFAKLILTKSAQHSFLQLENAQRSHLEAFHAPDYKYKSGDVLAMMKGLKSTFATNKNALVMAEEEAKGSFNKLKMNIQKEIKFTQQEIDAQTLRKSKKDVERAKFEKENEEEQATTDADKSFLKDLTDDCAEKAELAAHRATLREQELAALDEAIAKLKEGGVGVDKEAARKEKERMDYLKQDEGTDKEVSLVQTVEALPNKASMSFLQVHETTEISKYARQMEKLNKLDIKMASKELSLAVKRVKAMSAPGNASIDPLAEVRKLLNDLITHKEERMAEDTDHNVFCNDEIEKHEEDRKNYQADIVGLTSQIETDNATKKDTSRQVAELSAEISQLASELESATKMRADDKAANEATVQESKEGSEACTVALDTLKAFYKPAFLQNDADPKNPFAKKIDPDAPDVNMGSFEDDAKQRSTGVLGLLEVLRDKYASTERMTTDEENEAVEKFEQFKTASDADVATKTAEIETKNGEIADLQAKLLEAKTKLDESKDKLKLTLESFEEIRGMCSGAANAAEEKRVREESISILKQTLGEINKLVLEEAR